MEDRDVFIVVYPNVSLIVWKGFADPLRHRIDGDLIGEDVEEALISLAIIQRPKQCRLSLTRACRSDKHGAARNGCGLLLNAAPVLPVVNFLTCILIQGMDCDVTSRNAQTN